VRHLNGRVRGAFKEWGGTVSVDPDQLIGGSVQVEAKTASVNTENERRDGHLRSPDFFDAQNHPTITFRSTRVQESAPVHRRRRRRNPEIAQAKGLHDRQATIWRAVAP